MCKDCDDWNLRGIAKRDFQHSKDGPEEITRHPKRRSKRWCRSKKGKEHQFEHVIWFSRNYVDSYGKNQVDNTYRWICKGCGKVSWGRPKEIIPKHEHHYCLTKIFDYRWKHYQEIYEECCVCSGKGRSYKFYD